MCAIITQYVGEIAAYWQAHAECIMVTVMVALLGMRDLAVSSMFAVKQLEWVRASERAVLSWLRVAAAAATRERGRVRPPSVFSCAC